MNNNLRTELTEALHSLGDALGIVERVKASEEWSMNCVPENFQGGERYEKMEDAVCALEDAEDSINSAMEYINNAMD